MLPQHCLHVSDRYRQTFEASSNPAAKMLRSAVPNKPQAALLLTYMRNNSVVRDFKKRLVRGFYDDGRDPQNAGTPSRCGCSAPSGDVSGRCSASTIPAGASHTQGMALTARIPVASRPWSLALSPSR